MFDQTFVNTQAQTRRPWTMAASLGFQTAVVGTLLLIPLLHPEMLRVRLDPPVWVPLRQITKQTPPEPKSRGQHSSVAPRPNQTNIFHAPPRIPDHVSRVVDAGEPDLVFTSGRAGLAVGESGSGGLFLPMPTISLPAQPPAPVRKPEPPKAPIAVSSGVQSALLLFGPKPNYPALAKTAGAQGTVRIQAVIAKDGSIQGLKVMSGHPLLVDAALNAVKQWRYRPTLLNGDPVEVATEIDVNFTLNR